MAKYSSFHTVMRTEFRSQHPHKPGIPRTPATPAQWSRGTLTVQLACDRGMTRTFWFFAEKIKVSSSRKDPASKK